MLLLGLQPSPDKKSRLYLYLESIFFLYSAATATLNFCILFRWDIQSVYDVITICSLALVLLYYTFGVESTSTWNKKHRWLRRLLVIDLLIGIGLVLTRQFTAYVRIDDQGYLVASIKPMSIALIVVPIWLFTSYTSLLLLWNIFRARSTFSKKFQLGLVFIGTSLTFSVLTPFFRIVGGPITTIGLLLIIPPTLREYVFDPVARLNDQLRRRSEQLQAITRVSQVANSLLSVNELTATIADEVKQSLAFADARIFTRADISEVSPIPAVVHEVLFTQQAVRANGLDSELAIPLTVAGKAESNRELIGVFYLRSESSSGFDDQTVEVIHILANQIAIAYQNARLFEQTQAANEAKTRFIGYISHEIRNPIGTIFTTAQIIIEHGYVYDTPLPPEYLTDFKRIYRQAEHARDLINDLLDMGRIEADVLKLALNSVDPVPVLKEVQQAWLTQLNPQVTFQSKYSDALPVIYADKTRLTQILMNIVSNAAKFTEQGVITLSACADCSFLRFEVNDTGRGMSDHVLSHLFEPYTQDARDVANPRQGTGLGLSISKRLIELHGGVIEVASQPDKGTTIAFTIPLGSGLSVEPLK